jgi:hypothetical protein
MNSSVFGIMMFSFLAAALLTMVVGNPLTINAVQQVSISQNANSYVGLGSVTGSSDVQCPNVTAALTTSGSTSGTSNFTGVAGFANSLYNYASTVFGLVQHTFLGALTPVISYFLGQTSSPVAACTGGYLNNANSVTAEQITAAVGSTVIPKSVSNNPQVDTAIGIAVVFIGLGLLAGVLGAGMLAGVLSSVGIVLSVVYYMLAEMSLPNAATGVPYFTFPAPISLIFTAFISVCVIWMLATSLNSK